MSDLLQQAMIDAAALKEVAMKNAQNALIEKYSSEFNQTLQKLLEQEDVAAQPEQQSVPSLDPAASAPTETDSEAPDLSAASVDPLLGGDLSAGLEGDKKDAFSSVPSSFSDSDEDQLVTIDFDQIEMTLNEMLNEAYDSKQQLPIRDALGKGGNPSMIVKMKSQDAVTEKWHQEELEQENLTMSDEQQELEEVELMGEEELEEVENQPPANPAVQSAQAKQAATTSASSSEDQALRQALIAAGIKPNNPKLTSIIGFLKSVDAKVSEIPSLVKLAPILAAAAGTVAGYMEEQELSEESAGSAAKVRGQELKAQGEKEIARGTAMDAAEQKKEAGTSTMTPKQMEEEIDLTEEELQELAEELRVDLNIDNLSDGYMGSTVTQKREQRNLELAAARDSKATEAREEELEKMKDLMQENKKLSSLNKEATNTLSALKDQLEKMNLVNAKLLYTNKALGNISLNERQKQQIVESISKADSVLAAKTIYETLQNAVESKKESEAPQSLRETLNKAATPFVVKKSVSNSLNDLMADRMKALAGIKAKK